MTVTLNGKPHDLGEMATVADAVARLTDAGFGVAVAVNGTVVPRSEWAGTMLTSGDTIEVLTAVQGG
jgi:sulfur carrier protein